MAKKKTGGVGTVVAPEVSLIWWEELVPSPHNRRRWRAKDSDDPRLVELADNLERHGGNFEPVLVRPIAPQEDGNRFEIVAGERRWRATRLSAQRGGERAVNRVLCLVRELTDDEAIAIMLDENRRRENLSPLEEADTLLAFMEAHAGWGVEEAASALGVSRHTAARRLRLVNLSERWQRAIVEGRHPVSRWTAAHWELVARHGHATQDEFLDGLIEEHDDGFNEYEVGEVLTMTAEDVKLRLGNLLYSLAEAPFDLKVAIADAPACVQCTLRAANHLDLFEAQDLREGKKKIDRCMDGACYDRKATAHRVQLIEAAREKYGEVVLVQKGRIDGTPWEGEKTVRPWEAREVEAGTAGAVPAFDVGPFAEPEMYWVVGAAHGGNGAGESLEKTGGGGSSALAEKREKLNAKRRLWLANELANRAVSWAGEERPRGVVRARPESDGRLALALVCLGGTISGTWWEQARHASEQPREVLMDLLCEDALRKVATRLRSYGKDMAISEDHLRGFCEVFGLNWGEEWAKVYVELPEPKAWATQGKGAGK